MAGIPPENEILTDGCLTDADMTLEVADMLRASGPFGQYFPEPLFDGEFDIVKQQLLADKHVKFLLKSRGSERYIDAIAFNVERECWPNPKAKTLTAAYRLDINEYRGIRNIQLIIEHIL